MRLSSNRPRGARRAADGTRLGWATLVALGLHAPLVVLMNGRASRSAHASDPSLTLVYPIDVAPIDVAPIDAAPPPQREEAVHAAPRRRAPTTPPAPERPEAPYPAPEEAGGGHVAEAAPADAQGAPLDLTQVTGATVVSTGVAGGRGLSTGAESQGQGDGHAAHGRGPPGPGSQGSTAGSAQTPGAGTTPVSLVADSWACPWPPEAESQPIRERTVVLRVVVSVDGRPESAELVADPGHGFGAAAIACAMEARFVPARNGQGDPMRARSPPIRVTFTR